MSLVRVQQGEPTRKEITKGGLFSCFLFFPAVLEHSTLRAEGAEGGRISFEILPTRAARLEVCRMVRCPKTCKHVGGARKKHLLWQVLFSMKRTLRCMKNEAGLRPMKRGFATCGRGGALRFMFAKQMHHASVASASYRRRRCII